MQKPLEEKVQDALSHLPLDREKEYVVECIKNGLQRTTAAKTLGLPAHAAYNKRPNKALGEIVKAVADELGITAKEVIAGLRAEARGTAIDPRTKTPLDTSAAARVGAWRLLGQTLSMFTENHEINSNIRVEFVTDWRGEKLEKCEETPALETGEVEDAEIVQP